MLYSRLRIIVLDDSFSALDSKTGGRVIQNLLGTDGALRQLGTTVIWISNNGALNPFFLK
jgi:ATP-binding cassette subfamily C (CFTR/MRP) protein 1